MNYSQYITEAIERHKKYNFPLKEFKITHNSILTEEGCNKLIEEIEVILQGELRNSFEFKCFKMHKMLLKNVEEIFNTNPIYTIGCVYFRENNKACYDFDDFYIDNLLCGHEIGKKIKAHAWITLPSLEIIDVTLSTNLFEAGLTINNNNACIFDHADKSDFIYKPMLFGEDVLKELNLLYD